MELRHHDEQNVRSAPEDGACAGAFARHPKMARAPVLMLPVVPILLGVFPCGRGMTMA